MKRKKHKIKQIPNLENSILFLSSFLIFHTTMCHIRGLAVWFVQIMEACSLEVVEIRKPGHEWVIEIQYFVRFRNRVQYAKNFKILGSNFCQLPPPLPNIYCIKWYVSICNKYTRILKFCLLKTKENVLIIYCSLSICQHRSPLWPVDCTSNIPEFFSFVSDSVVFGSDFQHGFKCSFWFLTEHLPNSFLLVIFCFTLPLLLLQNADIPYGMILTASNIIFAPIR